MLIPDPFYNLDSYRFGICAKLPASDVWKSTGNVEAFADFIRRVPLTGLGGALRRRRHLVRPYLHGVVRRRPLRYHLPGA